MYPSNQAKNRITCFCGNDLKRKIRKKAYDDEKSMSDVVLDLIKKYFEMEDKNGNIDKKPSRE